VNGQLHDPAALPPGEETLVPIVYEAGWANKLILSYNEIWKQVKVWIGFMWSGQGPLAIACARGNETLDREFLDK
jgi:hypothetical protein